MLDANLIRSKINIVDVISQYIKVSKQGRNHVSLCPFHADSNPSMMISQEKQIFKCFVCGVGGNVFSFVQNYEKISFSAAIKKVAFLAGLAEEEVAPIDPVKGRLAKANSLTQAFFTYYLKNIDDNHYVSQYLKRRGIDEELIERFKIGYAPNDNSLIDFLQKKGVSNEDILTLGLGYARDGMIFSRFRDRLMFSIIFKNIVAGFSGRIIKESDEAKYVNSSESPLFIKNEILYNYDEARIACMKERKLYLVEGFMDVIALAKAQINNVCATMGTALTNQHVSLLKQLSSEIILTFDGDNAGQMAVVKSFERIGDSIPVSTVDYQNNEDPDEIFNRVGREGLIEQLNQRLDPMDFYFKYYLQNYEAKTIRQREEVIDILLSKLALISNISRAEYLRTLAQRTGVDMQELSSAINQMRKASPEKNMKIKSREVKLEERKDVVAKLLIWMLCNNEDGKKYLLSGQVIGFHDPVYFIISQYINQELIEKSGHVDVADVITKMENEDSEGNERAKRILLEIFEGHAESGKNKIFSKILERYEESKRLVPQKKGSLDDQFNEQAEVSIRELDTFSIEK